MTTTMFSNATTFYGEAGGIEVIEFAAGTYQLTSPLVIDRAYATRRLLLVFPPEGVTFDCSVLNGSSCASINNSVMGSGKEIMTHGGVVTLQGGGVSQGLTVSSVQDRNSLFATQLCLPFEAGSVKSNSSRRILLSVPCSASTPIYPNGVAASSYSAKAVPFITISNTSASQVRLRSQV